MENLINEIIDAPKMVSDKIPGNITSMVQGSDGNISKWWECSIEWRQRYSS